MLRGWQIPAILAGAAIVGFAGTSSPAGAELAGGAFLCAEVRAAQAPRGLPPLPIFHPRVAVSVVDRFSRPSADDPHTLDLLRTAMLCRSVSLAGAEVPDQPYDFAVYRARRTRRRPMPATPPPLVADVAGPFGNVRLRINGVAALAVPTLTADADGAPGLPPEHFACYAARAMRVPGARVAVQRLVASHGTEGQRITVRKPRRFCIPASVRGADPGAPKHAVDLLCYETRAARDPNARAADLIATRNAFGREVMKMGAARLLCVAVPRP